MPYRKKEEAPQEKGRFCPKCKATLMVSKRNIVYCPNRYTARACDFRGYPAQQGPAKKCSVDIKPLETASDEQQAIFDYCSSNN